MTEDDNPKKEQKRNTTEENKSASNDNPKDPSIENKAEENSSDKKEEDALEESKERFLDTKEKLIEANNDPNKPGNREYLSFYIYQREWQPTKPIGPITAQDKGPGPAVTNLPTTIGDNEYDVRRARAPAFKFGRPPKNKKLRTSPTDADGSGSGPSASDPSGPGPAKYNTRHLTNKGKDECKAPKVGERIKGLSTSFTTPGPAAYCRGDGDAVIYPHSPAFSMRPRTQTTRAVETPDPGAYTLPSTFGAGMSPYAGSPAFSMGGRLEITSKRPKIYPGPGKYNLVYPNATKKKAPAFSMGEKISTQAIVSTTPGPASNEIHLVKFHKPATPRFTFGIRHSPFKAFQTFAAEE